MASGSGGGGKKGGAVKGSKGRFGSNKKPSSKAFQEFANRANGADRF